MNASIFWQPRFYAVGTMLTIILLGMLSLPDETRLTICEQLQGLQERLQEIHESEANTSEPVADHASNETAQMEEILNTFGAAFKSVLTAACPDTTASDGSEPSLDPTSSPPDDLPAQEVQGVSVQCTFAAFTAAYMYCLFVPKRPRVKKGGVTQPLIGTANHGQRGESEMGYEALAIRSAQFRGLLVYAILSGLVTVVGSLCGVARPDFETKEFWTSNNQLHFVGLCIAGAAAAIWCCQRPAARYPNRSVVSVAWHCGFGALFFAGLVALSLALPYQMLNPATSEAMLGERLMGILIVRLILLPIAGLVAAGAMVCIVRKYMGIPVNFTRKVIH